MIYFQYIGHIVIFILFLCLISYFSIYSLAHLMQNTILFI